MNNKLTLGIIGGGASGLIAAISAKEANPNCQVTVMERMDRVGKKILATGNGRCNITNMGADIKNFHGSNVALCSSILKAFTPNDTRAFFMRLGVLTKEEEEGKVYPYSDQASSVLDCLRMRMGELDTHELVNCEVKGITKHTASFLLETNCGQLKFDKIIIAGGGMATPNLGSNGSCYQLLATFGHKKMPLLPVLVQLKTPLEQIRGLKGIKVKANASIFLGNRVVKTCDGEVLFTEYGLSGPPIFQLSILAHEKKASIALDLLPEYSLDEVNSILNTRISDFPNRLLEELFIGIFHKRLGLSILKDTVILPLNRPIASLTQGEVKKIATALKGWQFELLGTMGFQNAQVTAGGITLDQFDTKTLESRLVPGLFACGEVLDVHGDCGGYNLQWAWASGAVVGREAAKP